MSEKISPNKHLLLIWKNKTLAVPVNRVLEIMPCPRIFALPVLDHRISGLVQSGTSVVPVLRFDGDIAWNPKILILFRLESEIVALPADDVIRVESVDEKRMPDFLNSNVGSISSRWPGLLSGISSIDKKTILVLNPDAIMPESA